MRTHSALRAASPSEEAVRRLSDRALRAAALNPDHSEAARAAAAAELRARGGALDPWRHACPSFLAPVDVARGARLFFGIEGAIRSAAGKLAIAAGFGAAACAVVAFYTGVAVASIAAMALAGLCAALVILWLFASIFRAKPARILFLASRADAATRAPARRMLSTELRPFGHILSFAQRAEAGAVRSAADYRARANAMRSLIGMNISAMLAPEALPLSASDHWRAMIFDLALASSDVVIADLSDGGDSTLSALAAEGAIPRCVFVCLWGRLDEASAGLRTHQIEAPCFYYAPDGEMQRRSGFRAAVLSALRATHGVAA
ncbi:MAG: hypothetical protein K2P58_00065 [Hyphomonadaceae bacterium]|nr:hypothetical protein [Hyphomonadaceae bacterium]